MGSSFGRRLRSKLDAKRSGAVFLSRKERKNSKNSIIKIMITDFKSEGAVLGDPIVSSDFRIHKEEYRIRDRIALKANFSGYNRFRGRGVIDSAERYG